MSSSAALNAHTEAIQAITSYHWPGNIRELENAIQRAVILCENDQYLDYTLLSIDLDLIHMDEEPGTSPPCKTPAIPEANEDLSLEDYFQRFVLETSRFHERNRAGPQAGREPQMPVGAPPTLGIPAAKANPSVKEFNSQMLLRPSTAPWLRAHV